MTVHPMYRGTHPADELLARARRELAAAEAATWPGDRFRHAHLAALRAAAAVLARRAPSSRSRPRPVWELLVHAAPELGAWAAFFAAGAGRRAAIESGRDTGPAPEVADHLLCMARLFVEEVETEALAQAS